MREVLIVIPASEARRESFTAPVPSLARRGERGGSAGMTEKIEYKARVKKNSGGEMKKVILLFLMMIVVMAGCRRKEEPKTQMPGGSIQSQEDISALQDAVRKDPKNISAWINLGNILMDTSRFDEAINAYQKVLDMDPKNVDVRVDMGTCYRRTGKPDIAVNEYRKALEVNPNHLMALKNLGVVLEYDMKDNKQAIRTFEKYLQAAPNAADAARVKLEIEKMRAAK
jgi:cytochrome c-type biogenesis protein CcmH/NrfG